MKIHKFGFNKYVYNIFFPKQLIKTKIQVLEILMEALRHILVEASNNEKQKESNVGQIVLHIDKMSRIFFCSKDKSYSIIFPFMINQEDESLSFVFLQDGIEVEVNHELVSNVISVIKSESFNSDYSFDFITDIDQIESSYNENFWILMRYLLFMEDGYIRYDIDAEGYNKAKDKGKEHTHPLHHLDVFYTSKVTFKLGLEKEITDEEFIDSINIRTNCKYLKEHYSLTRKSL